MNENHFIQDLLSGDFEEYWIGGRKRANVWRWINGDQWEQTSELPNWKEEGRDFCASMNYLDGKWMSQRCNVKLPYICKQNQD